MLRAIARYCECRNVTETPELQLRRVISPQVGNEEGTLWDDTIGLAGELGLLTKEEDSLRFEPEVTREIAAGDERAFRRALRRRVLDAEHNDGLWSAVPRGWSAEGSREFSRIAAWFLQTPVEALQATDPYDLARREVTGPKDAKLVENDTQWRAFLRWATTLGLASTVGGVPFPDPTVAVEEELGDLPSSGELAAPSFRDHIVERLPVLLGGRYASGLDAHLRVPPRRDERSAGVGLSLALRRLARRPVIAFDRRSDAEDLRLDGSDPSPTHILLGARP